MKKIFTIRDPAGQREHMWNSRLIDEEVAVCSNRAITRYFLEYLPKDAPILEAGCGLGAWVIYLSELGYDVTGIDNDATVIARLKEWRPSLNVLWGDIRNLPFSDNELGAVVSLGVVEHFEEGCGDALNEAHRVLRPGGLLFLTVPMNNVFRQVLAHPLRALYLKWRKGAGDGVFFAEYRYSKKEVKTLLLGNGFELILMTWDDFSEKQMSLGIWADFPPLQGSKLYDLKTLGKIMAAILNTLSPWIASAGVLCIAKKRRINPFASPSVRP